MLNRLCDATNSLDLKINITEIRMVLFDREDERREDVCKLCINDEKLEQADKEILRYVSHNRNRMWSDARNES